jgi:hypothetical protein
MPPLARQTDQSFSQSTFHNEELMSVPGLQQFRRTAASWKNDSLDPPQFCALNEIQSCPQFCQRLFAFVFQIPFADRRVLDETDPDDGAVLPQVHLKEFLLGHAGEIEDQKILDSVVTRLNSIQRAFGMCFRVRNF